jgi:hypothetical protein
LSTLSHENRDLLALEKWDDIFKSNDKERMEQEMESLQDALRDIRSEVNIFL